MSLRLPTILVSLAFAVSPAIGQTAVPQDAPIPQDGVLIQEGPGLPIEDQIDTGGLPGVDFDDAGEDSPVRGPGGLQNNTGAVGTNAPDTSGYNPEPLETPLPDDEGLPLSTPLPQ
ncbi:MAG: hypothetical protein V7704_05140 [Aurantimonas endophytica]|uniref:Uncharacterized protein n=1 Tax=Aurantimonas endophytica TaxID=1522175 RepID=A0A7W6HC07_9HYPH|nr:hypothetical protein [Aurantimonas endophytica]MBB4002376.1 hypothetical protein [Aurantimonas endophytica]MCO6402003.1 hypothetical protein [Aurantimonas endophytica]